VRHPRRYWQNYSRQAAERRRRESLVTRIQQDFNVDREQALSYFQQLEQFLMTFGDMEIGYDLTLAANLSSKSPLEWEELRVFNDGERGAWSTVDSVRADHKGRYRFACSYVPLDGKVLDVACGIGYGSYIISKDSAAKEIVAVDVSEDALEYGRKYYQTEKIKFVQGDCHTVLLPDDYFDLVVSFETVEHLEQPELFLRRLNKSLKSDGYLIISSPNESRYPYGPGSKYHVRHYTPAQLIALLEMCGFSIAGEFNQQSRESQRVFQGTDGLYLIMVCHKQEGRYEPN